MKSTEDSCLFDDCSEDSKPSSSIEGTSNPRSNENFSVFGDGSCGEPMFAQRLTLDFTPNEHIDTDFVQRKIYSFWDFIKNTPEIHNLMVKADLDSYPQESSPQSTASETDSKPENKLNAEPTAVSILDTIEEKGLLNHLFETKLPQSQCSLGSPEYELAKPKKKTEKKSIVGKSKSVCSKYSKSIKSIKSGINEQELQPLIVSCPEATALTKKMNEWDAKHPKSMEPPGHPPTLQHAILQRSIPK